MKRIVTFLLAIACLFSLTACSQAQIPSETDGTHDTSMPSGQNSVSEPTEESTLPTVETDPDVPVTSAPQPTETTSPTTDQTEPITQPTEPATAPTESVPTEPVIQPTEPATQPTEAPTKPTTPENNSAEDYRTIANKYVGRWYLDGYADVYIDVTLTQGGMFIETTNYSLYSGADSDSIPAFTIYPQKYIDSETGGGWVSGTGIRFFSWHSDLSFHKIQLHEDNIQISEHIFVKEKGTIVGHEWSDATCTEPKICTICGETEGVALGHSWLEDPAGYQEPNCLQEGRICYVCSLCGETQYEYVGFGDHNYGAWIVIQEPTCTDGQEYRECIYCYCREDRSIAGSGHNWQEATCTTAKTCTVCGIADGGANGHNWESATCTEPKFCKTCGTSEGNAAGHNWKQATCIEPKTCKICGITEGTANGHNWLEATCTTAKTCSNCSATEGVPDGHNWNSGKCQVCFTIIPEYVTEKFLDELEGVSLTYTGITYDSYGRSKGFSIWFQVVNNTDEMICVQTRNEKVNGHSCWITMSDYVAPHTTQTVELYVAASDSSLAPTLNDYGEDMVKYVEFNFHVSFVDRDSNKFFTSPNLIVLYPYEQ